MLPPRRASCDDILGAVQAVKLNYSFPFQDARSDDSSRLSFLRTRTLGDRIRDTRTWARDRRQSQEKEASPQEAGGQEPGGQESRDAPETEEKEEPGEMFGSQSRLSDSSSASP